MLEPTEGQLSRSSERPVGWAPQQPAVYSKLSVSENLALFARLEKLPDPEAAARMLDQIGLEDRDRDEVGTLSGGNRQRVNIGVGLLSDPRCCSWMSPRPRLIRASGSVCGSSSPRWPGAGRRGVCHAQHRRGGALCHSGARLVDGELLFAGTPAGWSRPWAAHETSRRPSCASSMPAGTEAAVRWLLIKDLQILRPVSPAGGAAGGLPVVVALMIGFALSSPPGKPKVAYFSQVAPGHGKVKFGNQTLNVSQDASALFQSIQPIRVHSEPRR